MFDVPLFEVIATPGHGPKMSFLTDGSGRVRILTDAQAMRAGVVTTYTREGKTENQTMIFNPTLFQTIVIEESEVKGEVEE
jgi:hypothetical protein